MYGESKLQVFQRNNLISLKGYWDTLYKVCAVQTEGVKHRLKHTTKTGLRCALEAFKTNLRIALMRHQLDSRGPEDAGRTDQKISFEGWSLIVEDMNEQNEIQLHIN